MALLSQAVNGRRMKSSSLLLTIRVYNGIIFPSSLSKNIKNKNFSEGHSTAVRRGRIVEAEKQHGLVLCVLCLRCGKTENNCWLIFTLFGSSISKKNESKLFAEIKTAKVIKIAKIKEQNIDEREKRSCISLTIGNPQHHCGRADFQEWHEWHDENEKFIAKTNFSHSSRSLVFSSPSVLGLVLQSKERDESAREKKGNS